MQIRHMHEFVQTSTSKQFQLDEEEDASEEMLHEFSFWTGEGYEWREFFRGGGSI